MRLSAAIEVLSRLDDETRARLFGDEWPVMWGMRNRIAHGYLVVDRDIILATMDRDVPGILHTVTEELNRIL